MKKCFIVLLALVPCFIFAQQKSYWQDMSENLYKECVDLIVYGSRNNKDSCHMYIRRSSNGKFRFLTEVFDTTTIPKGRTRIVTLGRGDKKRMIAFDIFFPEKHSTGFMGYEVAEVFEANLIAAVNRGLKSQPAFIAAIKETFNQ